MLAAVLAGVLAIAAGFQTLRETKARHNATKARDDATIAASKEAEARKQAEQNEKLAKSNETLAKTKEQLAQSEARKARREAERARVCSSTSRRRTCLTSSGPRLPCCSRLKWSASLKRTTIIDLSSFHARKRWRWPLTRSADVPSPDIRRRSITWPLPDGKTLASASGDCTVRLWDLTARDPNAAVRTLTGHQDSVSHVAFGRRQDPGLGVAGPHGAAVGPERRDPNAAVRTLTGHQDSVSHVAFAPDGKTLASASQDHTVRLWDLSGA